MQDHEAREKLRASLLDGQLSRTERDDLRDILAAANADATKRAVYQSMAFDLARESLERQTAPMHSVLNWLERVVKLIAPPIAAKAPAAPVAEACFSPQHDCAGRIVQLFDRVKSTAEVCVFTITDDRIADAMVRVRKRGARLRVITDDEKQFDPGSDVDRLLAAGIDVRTDRTEHHMHHKFAIFDGALLLTGSYNWTRSAAYHNEENFVLTDGQVLVRSFADLFERLWLGFGKQ